MIIRNKSLIITGLIYCLIIKKGTIKQLKKPYFRFKIESDGFEILIMFERVTKYSIFSANLI